MEMYLQTSNLQSEALRNAISELNQEVSTYQSWSDNAVDSNGSRINDFELMLRNANPDSNIQTMVCNSVTSVVESL